LICINGTHRRCGIVIAVFVSELAKEAHGAGSPAELQPRPPGFAVRMQRQQSGA